MPTKFYFLAVNFSEWTHSLIDFFSTLPLLGEINTTQAGTSSIFRTTVIPYHTDIDSKRVARSISQMSMVRNADIPQCTTIGYKDFQNLRQGTRPTDKTKECHARIPTQPSLTVQQWATTSYRRISVGKIVKAFLAGKKEATEPIRKTVKATTGKSQACSFKG